MILRKISYLIYVHVIFYRTSLNLRKILYFIDYYSLLYQISRESFNHGRSAQIDVHYHEAEFQIANSNRESVLSSYNNLFKHILRIVNISANKNTGIRFDIKSLRQLKLISFESAYNSFL